MLSNSKFGGYLYPAASQARPHAPVLAGPHAYSYDANGYALSNGTQTYVWDGENRLLSVSEGGVTTSFTYGPDGTRLKKVAPSGTTIFLLGSDIEISPSGVYTKYPHPDAVRVGTGQNPARSWLHRDHSQSIRMRIDAPVWRGVRSTLPGKFQGLLTLYPIRAVSTISSPSARSKARSRRSRGSRSRRRARRR
jgi:hypothetical protein